MSAFASHLVSFLVQLYRGYVGSPSHALLLIGRTAASFVAAYIAGSKRIRVSLPLREKRQWVLHDEPWPVPRSVSAFCLPLGHGRP